MSGLFWTVLVASMLVGPAGAEPVARRSAMVEHLSSPVA